MCVAFGLQGGGTGKTTISFNVAVKMAREGRRVFFIGMDMGRQSAVYLWDKRVADHIYKGEIATIREYFKGKARPLEIAYESNMVKNLFFVPAGHGKIEMKELRRSADMFSKLVSEYKKYGRVIVDCPGSGGLSSVLDYLMIFSSCDSFVPVVEPNEASIANAIRLANMAHLSSIPVNLVVLNKVKDGNQDMMERARKILTAEGDVILVKYSDRFVEAYERGALLVDLYPESDEAKSIARIAEIIERRSVSMGKVGSERIRTALSIIEGQEVAEIDLSILRHVKNLFRRK
jgi:MinD-like ATPase involved in chromosome partitioning or flagellar assembly